MARHVDIDVLALDAPVLDDVLTLTCDENACAERKTSAGYCPTLCGHLPGCRRAACPLATTAAAIAIKS